ncbi:growth hormone secretagogue receptor type 1-like [Microcaecilia unicolor]|uniref:Growth hormone secretagogue receptor type 1 n=1 Tax=Microcaecilia unicolor TaxID=1415580 RepID=A0A6P7X0D9_9AMPH|nr:growth hormone secretagogue receptor type 1-like [Microcaecilia unicolor]
MESSNEVTDSLQWRLVFDQTDIPIKEIANATDLKDFSKYCSGGCHHFTTNSSSPLDLLSFHPFSFPALYGITAICALLFIIGVAGNIMTILIISRFKGMRTTTNLYLSSMALSDIFIFLCMPFDLYKMWRYRPWNFGDLLCKFTQFLSEACTYSTILHITALSVERYLAVFFPLRAKVIITRTKIKILILILWTLALSSAGPVFVLVGVEYENGTDPADTSECKCTSYAVTSGLLNTMAWVSSLYFFVPVCCLSILYGLIGRKLWKRKKNYRDKNNTQTVKMLAVIVLAFVLCWLPFHVGRNLLSLSLGTSEMHLITQYFSLVSCVLFYLSAAINPILYNIMSARYRDAACKMLGFRSALPQSHFGSRKESCSGPGVARIPIVPLQLHKQQDGTAEIHSTPFSV